MRGEGDHKELEMDDFLSKLFLKIYSVSSSSLEQTKLVLIFLQAVCSQKNVNILSKKSKFNRGERKRYKLGKCGMKSGDVDTVRSGFELSAWRGLLCKLQDPTEFWREENLEKEGPASDLTPGGRVDSAE